MTEIRSIHGLHNDSARNIPHIVGNELRDRGRLVDRTTPYLPFLSMTQGEMQLALMLQRARIYAAAYPDLPEYKRAATMLENALYAGISRGVSLVGSIEGEVLQGVARNIYKASRRQNPASKFGLYDRKTIADGIHIGAPIIDVNKRLSQCLATAKGNPAKVLLCTKAAKIENILNGGIEKSGHHMLYKDLVSADKLPADVITKRLLQQTGVEALAITGKIDSALMYEWVENAIIQNNANGNVGPLTSRQTSFVLGGRPAIGEPITATVIAITTLISTALAGAAAILKALRSEQAYAMSEARGFGTEAISANRNDWGGESEGNSNNILIGGALLAAYLLTNE